MKFSDHDIEVGVFLVLLGTMSLAGFAAARWRRPAGSIHDLEEWGVGGRAFGNWVTWFLLGGSMYSAYTFVAVPALTYGVGAIGFFAIPFAIICAPVAYIWSTRVWSVAHARGYVTNAEFVRDRYGSRTLALFVAITGIAATIPYISVQLVSLKALFETLGVQGDWPLLVAIGLMSATTFRSGLRAPALLSIAKDVLLIWVVLSAVLVVAMSGGWGATFDLSAARFKVTPNPTDGLILGAHGQIGYLTLVIGSAFSIFAYPHALTAILAAKDRATVKRNSAALPIYALALALMALLGFFAISEGIVPLGSNFTKGVTGDLNTITPELFHGLFPPWSAGIAYAAIAVAALIPAAVMAISAANLFTRAIYREYIRPNASRREEANVSRWTSLLVKFGAAALLLFIDPSFSTELQLLAGALVVQIIPAAFVGLVTPWFHRWALIVGMIAGLGASLYMLYNTPQLSGTGKVVVAHFGGSSWPLSRLGIDSQSTVYAGLLALLLNFAVAIVLTALLRLFNLGIGVDRTHPDDYYADADDPMIKRLDDLLDGLPRPPQGAHERHEEPVAPVLPAGPSHHRQSTYR
jgi:SSS family solute:Na+ symporter